MGLLHIYAPKRTAARRVIHCETCGCRRRVVQLIYVWHDSLWYCTGCGEDPGDWPRRFTKVTSERHRRIQKARRLYAAATSFKEAIKKVCG